MSTNRISYKPFLTFRVVAIICAVALSVHAFSQINDTEVLNSTVSTSQTVTALKSIALKPGFSTTPGVSFSAKILVDGYGTYTGTDTDPKNWTEEIVYNGNGTAVGHSRAYFDRFGRGIQSQLQDFVTGRAIVSQVVYDDLGRQAISTLPAAVGSSNLTYKSDFFTDPSGKNYSSSNFDGEKLDDPDKVNSAISGGLGWYYSENNTLEPYVPECTHPYKRIEYSDITGQVRRFAAAGNYYKMGSGHETYSFTIPASIDELGDYAINIGLPSYGLSKSISVDADGKMFATFTDASGHTIATARVGGGTTTNSYVYIPASLGWVDVYIGDGCENSLVLPVCNELKTFKIYNLFDDSLVKIVSGTGSAISISKGFYRIYCPPEFLGSDLEVSYKTNYSDLSLYKYDNLGRLMCSYSPKAVKSNSNYATTVYRYNALGMLIETTDIEQGKTQFIYRKDGSIRFSQNAKQRAETGSNVFFYINYDYAGRPVESGEYRGTVVFSPTMDPETVLEVQNCFDRTITTYDIADQDLLTIMPGYAQNFVEGKVSKIQNSNSTAWYSYTYDGRVEWVVRKLKDMNPVSIDYTYDFNGNVTNVIYQKNVATERFEHIYTYDANLRLAKVETRALSTDTPMLQAKYFYYAHGPLKRVEYGGNLQGVDYIYTENGVIKAINDPLLSSDDPGKDGYSGTNSAFGKDLFGMTLEYFAGDYIRANTNIGSIVGNDGNSYSGLIRAQRWRTLNTYVTPASTSQSWLFKYNYNQQGFLTDANFGTYDRSTSTATLGNAYSEKGITYDANGNIQTLTRFRDSNTLMDQVTYAYNNNTKPNQLSKVYDASTDATFGALPNGETGFTYNAIGQMVSRTEKGLTKYYKYDAYGLVEGIYSDASLTNPIVRFAYDENGFRYWKKDYSSTNKLETFYIRDASGNIMAVYEKTATTSILQKELPLYGSNRFGEITRCNLHATYELTDHLGNVRVLFGKGPDGKVQLEGYTDYYPHGMPMPNRQYTLGSRYRYGYQGQWAEEDPETGLTAYELRMLDKQLGRWLTPDPYSQNWSSYISMNNNPTIFVDPDGGFYTKFGAWLYSVFNGGEVHYSYDKGEWYVGNQQKGGVINGEIIVSYQRVFKPSAGGGYSGDGLLFTVADWTNNGIGGLATGMERSGGTFRLSNSNGFSPKHYASGWRGNGSVTTYNTATWGSRIAKGSLVVNLGLGAYSINKANIADGRTFGYNTQVATGQVAGGMIGSWAGAEAGAAAGAAIGVWFGGVGAVPGAIIGGVIGGVLGGWGGSELGGATVRWAY